MKPKVVFFSRAYQCKLFPLLASDKYDSIHVTLTKKEQRYLQKKGYDAEYCFETFTEATENIEKDYLQTSFFSDRFLNKYKIYDRNKILRKEIAFWSKIFDTYMPIAVINEQVAIEIAEVIYIESKKRGIKYLAWMNNPINGYFYWTSNPMSLSLDEKIFSKSPSLNSIETAKKYIKNIVEKNEQPYYLAPYLHINKTRYIYSAVKGITKYFIKEYLLVHNKFQYEKNFPVYVNFLERSLKTLFYSYNKFEEFKEYEIILFPLHYEPEASLLYLSEFFSNQLSVIENISKCLNHNQILVVKEHPAQQGMLLTKKYQNLYKNCSNLFYLPHSVTSYSIIKKATLIITLTSHLGWEAIILGKPVVLLGKMFYDKYPLLNKFISYDNLRKTIRNKNYTYPEMNETIKYSAQLFEISHRGMPFPGGALYDKNNIANLINSITKELNLND